MVIRLGAAIAVAVVTVGCSSGDGITARPNGPSHTVVESPSRGTSPSADPMASPSPSGLFVVAPDQRKLALACWRHGSPVVVFDAGSGDAGIARWRTSTLVASLAATTTVCAYDRAGLGGSDAAPQRARVLDDVARDLHQLLAAAGIARPVVMVGASGGGFDVYQHAGRYPADVAGLVMLDVPAGQPAMSHSGGPPVWSDPANPEHVDYYAVEHQMAVARLKIKAIPVTVVTAASGQSGPSSAYGWPGAPGPCRSSSMAGTTSRSTPRTASSKRSSPSSPPSEAMASLGRLHPARYDEPEGLCLLPPATSS